MPMIADDNGDGKSDLALYRPPTSQFISVLLAPLAIAMLAYLARRAPAPDQR